METKPNLIKKKPTPPQQLQQHDPFAGLLDQQITIQEKGGVIITGTFKGSKAGFIRLEGVTVIGRNRNLMLDWIQVDRSAIAHFHHALMLLPVENPSG